MADLVELKRRRDALSEARSNGLAKVSIKSSLSEETIEYRSDGEIAAAISALDREIASMTGGSPVQIVNIRTNRGW